MTKAQRENHKLGNQIRKLLIEKFIEEQPQEKKHMFLVMKNITADCQDGRFTEQARRMVTLHGVQASRV